MVNRRLLVLTVWCSVLALSPDEARAQYGATDGEWRSYGGDLGSTKYSPLDQIDAGNFNDLRSAWRWQSADALLDLDAIRAQLPRARASRLPGRQFRIRMFQATPLMIDGVLYISTALHQVAAIDAGTGEIGQEAQEGCPTSSTGERWS